MNNKCFFLIDQAPVYQPSEKWVVANVIPNNHLDQDIETALRLSVASQIQEPIFENTLKSITRSGRDYAVLYGHHAEFCKTGYVTDGESLFMARTDASVILDGVDYEKHQYDSRVLKARLIDSIDFTSITKPKISQSLPQQLNAWLDDRLQISQEDLVHSIRIQLPTSFEKIEWPNDRRNLIDRTYKDALLIFEDGSSARFDLWIRTCDNEKVLDQDIRFVPTNTEGRLPENMVKLFNEQLNHEDSTIFAEVKKSLFAYFKYFEEVHQESLIEMLDKVAKQGRETLDIFNNKILLQPTPMSTANGYLPLTAYETIQKELNAQHLSEEAKTLVDWVIENHEYDNDTITSFKEALEDGECLTNYFGSGEIDEEQDEKNQAIVEEAYDFLEDLEENFSRPLYVFYKANNGDWNLEFTTEYDFCRQNQIKGSYEDWAGHGGLLNDVMDFDDLENAMSFMIEEKDRCSAENLEVLLYRRLEPSKAKKILEQINPPTIEEKASVIQPQRKLGI